MVEARLSDVRAVRGEFHADVLVTNEGDRTAANVQVSAELMIGHEVKSSDQIIDFLSADEEVGLTFVFAEDPSAGKLTVAVGSYASP